MYQTIGWLIFALNLFGGMINIYNAFEKNNGSNGLASIFNAIICIWLYITLVS